LAFAFVLALIWMGDGSTSVFRKALVVLGVALSVGGIAMLRYLLLQGQGAKECLTLSSSGRLPASFACFQPPLMSNVGPHRAQSS
jgi:hypothetical protein